MSDSAVPLYGLILGGGRSRRMGLDKAALEYHGRPQLEIAFELLSPFCEKTFVGIRQEQAGQKVFAPFPQLLDQFPGEGPLAAIVSAQSQFPKVAWWVLACDLPFLDADTLSELLKRRQGQRLATGFLSQHDGRIEPLCAIYEPGSAPLLAAKFSEGLRCARKGMESLSPLELTLPKSEALENANTPEEREAFLSQIGKLGKSGESPNGTPQLASSTTVRVKVHLYAQLREKLGREIEVDLQLPATETELLSQFAKRFPELGPLFMRSRLAVDDSYLNAQTRLHAIDSLDVIAPVSGG